MQTSCDLVVSLAVSVFGFVIIKLVFNATQFSSDDTCFDLAFFCGALPSFQLAPGGIPCEANFIKLGIVP